MDSDIQTICRSLLTEYLVHNCYKNTAKAFLGEVKKLNSCVDNGATSNGNGVHQDIMDIDHDTTTTTTTNGNTASTTEGDSIGKYTWSLLDARKDLYDAILNGNIPQAFTLIHRHFPALAAYDTQDPMKLEIEQQNNQHIDTDLQYTIFKLRCQQFIEIVRTSSEIEAIQFAQTHLKPMHKDYRDLTNEVASLIAYPDPHNASCSHLLSQERRRQLADEVNKVVLALSNLRYETALERIKRHAEVIASERAAYHLDIPEDLDKPHSASTITEPSSPY